MSEISLFTPLRLGTITIANRIVMAPLTRMRAGAGNSPTELNVAYYAQRSSAGLIVAEGTAVSHQAQGYPNAPGIYTREQIAGWRRVTDAVHGQGGRIFLQIAHNGRNSHSSLVPNGSLPVAPSAIPSNLPGFTAKFEQVPIETPRSLETHEIPLIVEDFRRAAAHAMDAGFDGVELQGANSHLIDQFLEDGTNLRTDRYGGSPANRSRFLFEIVEQVSKSIGADRLAVRLSPFGQYGGISDSNPLQLFTFVIKELNKFGIAYLHLIEGRGSEIGLTDTPNEGSLNNATLFRPCFDGPLISAAAYNAESATQAVKKGYADAIAFGRLYIANPDLAERLRDGSALNAYDRSTFYGGADHGYIDYPRYGGPNRDISMHAFDEGK